MILSGYILFPVFPGDGREAERQLAALAAHTGHRTELVARRLSRDSRQAEDTLEAAARRLRGLGVDVAGTHLVDGSTADGILRQAGELDAAMIFMGAGPEARVDVRHTGVEAQIVARNAERPVWLAKPHTPAELETILCAVDERRASSEALRQAIELARCYGAQLRIVRVAHPPASIDPLAVGMTEQEHAEAQQSSRAHVEREYEEFLAGFGFDGIPRVDHRLLWAERASQALTDIATEDSRSLLVLGSAGTHRFLRPMLGTTSERVLQHAPCSLLFAKY